MKIGYIPHALSQMKDRGISEKDVKETLIKGQERYIQLNGRIKCSYKKKSEILVIIYKQDKENYQIITAYYKYES